MRFAYTIWNDIHYSSVEKVVSVTKDIADSCIVTTLPLMTRDNAPTIIDNGLRPDTRKAIEICRLSGREVGLQIIPTPQNARGKLPPWWQGWVNFKSDSEWKQFFSNFRRLVDQYLERLPEVDFYLLGAELTSTLKETTRWQALFGYVRGVTQKPLGYSHHFSLPLKHYYNSILSLTVLFGYFLYRDNIYGKVLERLLMEPFTVPKDQLVEVGKNIYHAPMIHPSQLDILKLNDYNWFILDRYYPESELRKRWEIVNAKGFTIEFMPAVRSWLKKYKKNSRVFVENDLNIGFTNCPDEYYKTWWRIFLKNHTDIADVLVVWDYGNFERWAKTIRHLT